MEEESLLERLKSIVANLDEDSEQGQLPKPYDFYKAIKNEGEDTGWRYECVGLGIEDLRQMIKQMENQNDK